VIGIPQRLSPAHSPCSECFCASGAAEFFDVPQLSHAIDSALSADASVALKHPLPQMAGIAA
jgi:hypothetical protein